MKAQAALIACSLLATPAHAIGYQIIDGMPTFGERPKPLDIFNLDWAFANDPDFESELFDCAFMPYVLGAYITWKESYKPPQAIDILTPYVPPAYMPPAYAPPYTPEIPPCAVNCGGLAPPPSVPEISTWLMLALGLIAIVAMSRVRRRRT